MKVTAHFSSYQAGAYQFCEQFPSLKAAVEAFRTHVNGMLDAPDAAMAVYPFTPEDNDMMSHGDYPLAMFIVGKSRRYGQRTVKREAI